jgi:hypothetical protein
MMVRSAGIHNVVSVVALVSLVGCEPARVHNGEVSPWGRFDGEVIAQWSQDGRNMTLREDFAFIDSRNRRWAAPAGSVVNGASIPPTFWSIIGGPFSGRYRNASVVHDVGCEMMAATWQDVHKMFYDACRAGGVDEVNAKLMYYAVYHFGPRWEPVTDTIMLAAQTGNGASRVSSSSDSGVLGVDSQGNAMLTVQRMARCDPPPPTAEEVAQVTQLLAEENVSPADIEQLDRKELRRRRLESSRGERAPRAARERSSTRDGWTRDEWRMEGAETPLNPLRGNLSNDSLRQQPGPRLSFAGGSTAPPVQPLSAQTLSGLNQGTRSLMAGTAMMAVTPIEEDRMVAAARAFIEDQCGEERAAEYSVDHARGAFRVVISYLQQEEYGGWQPAGTYSTLFIAANGQILESFNELR